MPSLHVVGDFPVFKKYFILFYLKIILLTSERGKEED